MGITDKITGRVKQAAGDLLGDEDLRRQGAQEERKAEARAELEQERARLQVAEMTAEERREEAERRAAAAARREFEKADRELRGEDARLEAARDRAERREQEVDHLEKATDPQALAGAHTREELYEEAQRLDIEGRSEMNKDELARAISRAR